MEKTKGLQFNYVVLLWIQNRRLSAGKRQKKTNKTHKKKQIKQQPFPPAVEHLIFKSIWHNHSVHYGKSLSLHANKEMHNLCSEEMSSHDVIKARDKPALGENKWSSKR